MKRSLLVAVCLAALAACGKAPEETTAEGSVAGISFSAPYAIYNHDSKMLLRDQISVLISDDPNACEHLEYDGESTRPFLALPDGSHAPSLWMDMLDHNDVMSSMRGVGEDLTASFDPGAPASSECGTAACQAAWLSAKKGSANLLSTNDPKDSNAAARGDFHLVFADGSQLSGTFSASPCTELRAKGCGCDAGAAGVAAPAFALLVLAAFRRRR